jgi:hypothetical protein
MGRAERGLKANAPKAASFSLTPPKGAYRSSLANVTLLLISHTLKGIVGLEVALWDTPIRKFW